jgi:hypothetical protein
VGPTDRTHSHRPAKRWLQSADRIGLQRDSAKPDVRPKQIDNVLNGGIGFVIHRFQLAVGPGRGVGLMMEATVGQRTAEVFVEEQE